MFTSTGVPEYTAREVKSAQDELEVKACLKIQAWAKIPHVPRSMEVSPPPTARGPPLYA